jgi:hypothetical protein
MTYHATVPANRIEPPHSFLVRMQLVRQVLADRGLTLTDKVIGVCPLMLHLHRTTGQLNPSLDTIAEETRTAKKAIVGSLAKLQMMRQG